MSLSIATAWLLPALAMVALLAGCGERQPDLTSPRSQLVTLRLQVTGADNLRLSGFVSYVSRSPDCSYMSKFTSRSPRRFFQTEIPFERVSSQEVVGRMAFPAPGGCDWQLGLLSFPDLTIEGRRLHFDVFPVFQGSVLTGSPVLKINSPVIYGCKKHTSRFGEPLVSCYLKDKSAPITLTFEIKHDI